MTKPSRPLILIVMDPQAQPLLSERIHQAVPELRFLALGRRTTSPDGAPLRDPREGLALADQALPNLVERLRSTCPDLAILASPSPATEDAQETDSAGRSPKFDEEDAIQLAAGETDIFYGENPGPYVGALPGWMIEDIHHKDQRLRDIINSIDDIVWEIDGNKKFSYVSPKLFDILGYRPEEVMGKSAEVFNLGEEVEQVFAIFRKPGGDSSSPYLMQNRFIHKGDRHRIILETSIKPIYSTAGQLIGLRGVCRDITSRLETEEKIRTTASELEAILTALPDLYIRLDAKGSVLSIRNNTPPHPLLKSDWTIGQSIRDILIPTAAKDGWSAFQTVIHAHTPQRIEVSAYANSRPAYYEAWLAPLLEDQVVAVVRDITDRKTHEMNTAAILDTSWALRQSTNLEETIRAFDDRVMKAIQPVGLMLVRVDVERNETVIFDARGIWLNFSGRRTSTHDTGLITKTILSGKPYYQDNPVDDPNISAPEMVTGLSSLAIVPMVSQNLITGALAVGGAYYFTEEDRHLINTLAEIGANALTRAYLFDQTERRLQRLSALRAVDLAISASMDLRVTLNILLGQITGQLDVQACAVLLINPVTQALEYTAIRGFRTAAVSRKPVRIGEGPAGKAAVQRNTVVIHAVHEAEQAPQPILFAGEEFQTYFAVPLIAKGQVKGVLEIYHGEPLYPDNEWMDFLRSISAQAAIAIDNNEMFDRLHRSNLELAMAYDATIEGWSRAMELRAANIDSQIPLMVELTLKVALRMGIPETDLVHLRRGVLLHDIGNIATPDAILSTRQPLTGPDWEVIHKHPLYAKELLSPIPSLRPALDIPLYHHERWDGSGYPGGLAGERIPLPARIFAVVDTWVSSQTERPFREALSPQQASEVIRGGAGVLFDPQIVDCFLSIIDN